MVRHPTQALAPPLMGDDVKEHGLMRAVASVCSRRQLPRMRWERIAGWPYWLGGAAYMGGVEPRAKPATEPNKKSLLSFSLFCHFVISAFSLETRGRGKRKRHHSGFEPHISRQTVKPASLTCQGRAVGDSLALECKGTPDNTHLGLGRQLPECIVPVLLLSYSGFGFFFMTERKQSTQLRGIRLWFN